MLFMTIRFEAKTFRSFIDRKPDYSGRTTAVLVVAETTSTLVAFMVDLQMKFVCSASGTD